VALLEEVRPCWRRCGLVGGGVSLGWTLRFPKSHARPIYPFPLLPVIGSDVGSQLLLQRHPCLPPCSGHGGHGLTSETTVGKPTVKCFLS
jgi:glycine/D-amino acid oxidase-like deaminating enzyme